MPPPSVTPSLSTSISLSLSVCVLNCVACNCVNVLRFCVTSCLMSNTDTHTHTRRHTYTHTSEAGTCVCCSEVHRIDALTAKPPYTPNPTLTPRHVHVHVSNLTSNSATHTHSNYSNYSNHTRTTLNHTLPTWKHAHTLNARHLSNASSRYLTFWSLNCTNISIYLSFSISLSIILTPTR